MKEKAPDWKLKLKYGKMTTPFKHFTVLSDGIAGELSEGFECKPGRAWMDMKTWALDSNEAADMTRVIGEQIGFAVDGRIEVYETEPKKPPGDKPHGYDIRFTPYDEES